MRASYSLMIPCNQHRAFIALGANLGEPLVQCRQALEYINNIYKTHLITCSSFYKSEPLAPASEDPINIPFYINAVCHIMTELKPLELLNSLQEIEKKMGRKRNKKWESRLIDLDLLSYDDMILEEKDLTIPHPEIAHRRFVLEPLKEIAPNWIHPLLKISVTRMADKIKDKLGSFVSMLQF